MSALVVGQHRGAADVRRSAVSFRRTVTIRPRSWEISAAYASIVPRRRRPVDARHLGVLGQPVRRHLRAAHPGAGPGLAPWPATSSGDRRRRSTTGGMPPIHMRDHNLGRDPDPAIPASVGMTEETMYEMYRLLAIAKYEARYVIPTAYAAQGHRVEDPSPTARWTSRVGPACTSPARSARPRPAGAGRGGDVPGVAGTADHRSHGRAPVTIRALPTGTARARPSR